MPLPVGGAVTLTVVLWVAAPALPLQVRLYVVLAVSADVDLDPLGATLPDHPPDAVQAVALLELQVSNAVAPLAMLVGLALKVTAGGVAATVTVVD